MSSEKEPVVSPPVDSEKYKAVLLDVAGTTTSTTFIRETLFKYAVDQITDFLTANWEKDEVKEALKSLAASNTELDKNGAVEKFTKASEENSTNVGFKKLQGLIYESGYQDKTLKSQVFPDVPAALQNWSKDKTVAIYSTGSVQSQKLLFSNTADGDLSSHINHYFDQATVGDKTDSASYSKIAEELKLETSKILFVSDDYKELRAAKQAGLSTVLIKRDDNDETKAGDFADEFTTVVSSFEALFPENSSKRKNEEEVDAKQAPPAKMVKINDADEHKETKTIAVCAKPATSEASESNEKPDSPKIIPKLDEVEPMEVDSVSSSENDTESKTGTNLEESSKETPLEKDGVSKDEKATTNGSSEAQNKPEPITEEKTSEEPSKKPEETTETELNKTEEAKKNDTSTTDNPSKVTVKETNGEESPKKETKTVVIASSEEPNLKNKDGTDDNVKDEEEKKNDTKTEQKEVEKDNTAKEIKVEKEKGDGGEEETKKTKTDNDMPTVEDKEIKEVTKNATTLNGKEEPCEKVKIDDQKQEEDATDDAGLDIKINKLETTGGSPAVSVEV